MINIIENRLARILLWFLSFLFLYKGKLDGLNFGIVVILGEIALRVDIIEKIQFGKLIIELNKLKEEIYADIHTVRELAEEMSRVTAYSLSRIGKFAPTDLNERLIESKDTLLNLLKKLKISDEKINDVLSPLNEAIGQHNKTKVQ